MNISFTRLAGEECSRCSVQLQHAAETHGKVKDEPRYHEQGCGWTLKAMWCAPGAYLECKGGEGGVPRRCRSGLLTEHDLHVRRHDEGVHAPQPPVKEALFTKRLTCYNETFASLMPSTRSSKNRERHLRNNRTTCILWHDSLAGRSGEEVAAAFYLLLTAACRDAPHVVLWLDNCPGQNKSWVLMYQHSKYHAKVLWARAHGDVGRRHPPGHLKRGVQSYMVAWTRLSLLAHRILC